MKHYLYVRRCKCPGSLESFLKKEVDDYFSTKMYVYCDYCDMWKVLFDFINRIYIPPKAKIIENGTLTSYEGSVKVGS